MSSSLSWQRVHFSGAAEFPPLGGVAAVDGGVGVGELLEFGVTGSRRGFFIGGGALLEVVVAVNELGGDVVVDP